MGSTLLTWVGTGLREIASARAWVMWCCSTIRLSATSRRALDAAGWRIGSNALGLPIIPARKAESASSSPLASMPK